MNDKLDNMLRREMAFAFWDDARDLQSLFDFTWANKENFTKTGRIKIVLNLVMACECALKAHVILSSPEAPPEELLKKIKHAGHSIKKLASLATYMQERTTYDALISLLDRIGVEVRYSLNASHTYFRSNETYAFYDETITNQNWINSVKEQLIITINYCQDALTAQQEFDWEVWFKTEDAFNDLMKKTRK